MFYKSKACFITLHVLPCLHSFAAACVGQRLVSGTPAANQSFEIAAFKTSYFEFQVACAANRRSLNSGSDTVRLLFESLAT